MRKRPEQFLEVQTIGDDPENWVAVIRPGEPHHGQASTAKKLGAEVSGSVASSSRKTMSPGDISEIAERFDKCISMECFLTRLVPRAPRAPSGAVRVAGFRDFWVCLVSGILPLSACSARTCEDAAWRRLKSCRAAGLYELQSCFGPNLSSKAEIPSHFGKRLKPSLPGR